MPDDLDQRGGQDRKEISLNQQHELTYWTQRLGVTGEELRRAVAAVGNQADDVERYLKEQSGRK
jgi:Protein of unknown function (DUF3606)